LKEALKRNPRDSEALLQRGELALDAQQYPQAEADLNQVLHLQPDSPEVHYALSRMHAARGSVQMQRQELTEALRLNPRLLRVRLELVRTLIDSNSAAAALSVLDATPEAQRDVIGVLEQRNWALLSTGQTAEAQKGVDRGLAVARTPEMLLQSAMLDVVRKRYREAQAALHEGLVQSPTDLRMLRLLVRSYAVQNQVRTAVDEVRAHAAKYPKSADLQYFLGTLLMDTGDRVQAKQALAQAKAANPGYTPADLAIAQIDLLQSNWNAARPELSAILSAKSNDPTARLWLGMMEEANGNHAAAITAFRKVIEIQPDSSTALNALAYLLAENGNQADEALKFAQKAKELDPKNAMIDDTLGWVLYRKGVYTSAVTYLESADAREGTARRKYHLAMAYLKVGDKKRGLVALKAGLGLDPTLPEAKMAQELFR
jgi:tetratricopeptide (TPR) repeat protein